MKEIEPELLAMRKAGYTRQEIADKVGLEKEEIKRWISRYDREQARIAAGLPPKHCGRPSKDSAPGDIITEQQYEINRLKIKAAAAGFSRGSSQQKMGY